jgi:hypothetical protein
MTDKYLRCKEEVDINNFYFIHFLLTNGVMKLNRDRVILIIQPM